MTEVSRLWEKCDIILTLSDFSTPLRSVELSKEWQRVHDWGKVRHYPDFVRLFHTSTPLRSVELSKEWQAVHDWGRSATISFLCQTIPHFHTSEKCGTKSKKWRNSGFHGQRWTCPVIGLNSFEMAGYSAVKLIFVNYVQFWINFHSFKLRLELDTDLIEF